MRFGETPTRQDVQKAKKAVWWDDSTDDEVAKEFPSDNDPNGFTGDTDDLSTIRSSMKRYEEQEAGMLEDQAYYKARFRLQFVEVNDE